MGTIGQYIARTTFGAFLLILVSLTTIIWITQALRSIDLVTSMRQTIFTFIGITGLAVPLLILVIAPMALLVALAYTLNKLNTDSEIVVMNAAGLSPWRIFLPFLVVGLTVAALVAALSAYISPKSLRELRLITTRVRADVVSNIIQPGQFTKLVGGQLMIHIRERRSQGELIGIFIDDQRDANEHATFIAERGQVLENEAGTFLLLENGSAQRLQAAQRDPAIVLFERYAFDLSQFSGAGATPTFSLSERYLWDIAWPDPNDPYFQSNEGRFRSELHDRLSAPLYPLVFSVIGFAVLGAPRTSRQSRALSLTMMLAASAALRLLGFASTVFAARTPAMVLVVYASLLSTLAGGLLMISKAAILEPPAVLIRAVEALQARLVRRAVPA